MNWICPLKFRVCSISPEPFVRFSLNFIEIFLSVRRCAESMTQLCRLKFKVTLQGHVIYLSIHVCSISPEPFKRFSLNSTQVFLSLRWCIEHMTQLPRLKVTGQGNPDLPLNFLSTPYIPNPLGDFHYTSSESFSLWDIVQNMGLGYASSMSRSHFKVMWLSLQFVSAPYLLNRSKDFH